MHTFEILRGQAGVTSSTLSVQLTEVTVDDRATFRSGWPPICYVGGLWQQRFTPLLDDSISPSPEPFWREVCNTRLDLL